MERDHLLRVTSEQIRLYEAMRAAVGREVADRIYPHVARYLRRLDVGGRVYGDPTDPPGPPRRTHAGRRPTHRY